MTGHLHPYKLKSGAQRWAVIVFQGKRPGKDGQLKDSYRWIRGFATKKLAQSELTRILKSIDEGAYIPASKQTVAEYLDHWLSTTKPNLAGKTFERYKQLVTNDIKPKLGNSLLSKLQPMQVAEVYSWLLVHGRKDGGGGLSGRTVLHVHRLLHRALKQAVLWQLRPNNPIDAVEAPKPVQVEMNALNEERGAWLIQAVSGTPLYMPVVYALCTGLRRGEILAQRWRDLDSNLGRLIVSQSLEQTRAGGLKFKIPKGKKRRPLSVPPLLIEALQEHRGRQEKDRLMFGENYQLDLDLIIALPDGSPWKPDSFSKSFSNFAKRIGLKGIRFHDLRHSHASQMLQQGVPIKTVQERLGHASASTTMNTYAHVFAGDDQKAVDGFDQKLRSALDKHAARRAD